MTKKLLLYLIPLSLAAAEADFTFRCYENHDRDTVFIFSHGLGATQLQGTNLFAHIASEKSAGSYCYNNYWIIDDPISLFNYPDAKNDNNEFHNDEVNLGQEKDIERLDFAVQETLQQRPENSLILVGVSRGAVTIINYMATVNPEEVQALVLESPFDHLKNVVKHLLKRFKMNWFPFSNKIALKLSKMKFPLINKNGIFPIQVVHKLSDIPIMIVHSRKDKIVPVNSSRRLYIKLVESGHEHVYYLELATGHHGKILAGKEGYLYQNVVHAFYRRYSLPHNEEFANKGEFMIPHCQPTVEEIKKRIKRKRTKKTKDKKEETQEECYKYETIKTY